MEGGFLPPPLSLLPSPSQNLPSPGSSTPPFAFTEDAWGPIGETSGPGRRGPGLESRK